MYERILGEITAWRYGIPGLLCGNTIGTNGRGMSVWEEGAHFWRPVATLVEYNLYHMTQLYHLNVFARSSFQSIKGLATFT